MSPLKIAASTMLEKVPLAELISSAFIFMIFAVTPFIVVPLNNADSIDVVAVIVSAVKALVTLTFVIFASSPLNLPPLNNGRRSYSCLFH